MINTEIFHIFHIISLFNLPFFHIFSISFHISTYFSSILSLSFYYSTYFSSVFSISFHYSTYLSSAWRYKTFHFAVLFPPPLSNRNVWNATLLAFLVHDVIKHFIFPYFFPVLFHRHLLTILKLLVSCFIYKQPGHVYCFPGLSVTCS
jgi:hypothetical protein